MKPTQSPALGTDTPLFGPRVEDRHTEFRLWAPSVPGATLIFPDREVPMARGEDGFWTARLEAAAGTHYRFRAAGLTFPDPACRQATAADGWSVLSAPFPPAGNHEPIRPWHESVICEVHVGTATPEGTFAALENRLEYFRDAGYTGLELMPVAQFPGTRNWGYDGTLIFAPATAYGTPDELRRLVERAHALGLTLILDVVYNHFGEEANYLPRYLPEWFRDDVETPWGPAINFDDAMARRFFYENARMWLGDYGFDGLRFDAIHEIKTDSRDLFLGELAEQCHAVRPDARLVLENPRNSTRWLARDAQGKPRNYRAQWNDDMHHVLVHLVSSERALTGYGEADRDPYADLETALAQGFVTGPEDGAENDGKRRPAPETLPPDSFITYIQNHDQIGNRADASRLQARIEPTRLDFAHFVKFLAPQIPLCFMGDEANLETPFPYFIDLPEADAAPKRQDRYVQMRENFNQKVEDGALPDPNAPETWASAKLAWEELAWPERQAALERFRTLARYRRETVWPLAASGYVGARSVRHGTCIIVTWTFKAGALSMALNPTECVQDCPCIVTAAPVSTGDFSQQGEVLRLGRWSAVAWVTT